MIRKVVSLFLRKDAKLENISLTFLLSSQITLGELVRLFQVLMSRPSSSLFEPKGREKHLNGNYDC